MKTEIIVQLQEALTHCWPTCNIPEVLYLQNEHRHVFHITAWKSVTSNDRQIEFIQFKTKMQEWLKAFDGNIQNGSCEWLASSLLEVFGLSRCRVLEDGENGAEVTA